MPDATAADVPTQPLSAARRPRSAPAAARSASCSCTGSPARPASMKPWARHLAEQGYAVEVPRLPGPRHHVAGPQPGRLDRLVRRGRAGLRAAARDCEPVVVGGLSMGGSVALRLAEERGDQVSGVVLVNPFVSSTRKDAQGAARSSSTSCRRCAGSSTTSRSPARTRSATPGSRSRASRAIMDMWKVVVPGPRSGHPAAALLPLRDRPRHRRLLLADGARAPSARPTSRSGSSRTATTSPRSTTTPRASSRSPRLSSRA